MNELWSEKRPDVRFESVAVSQKCPNSSTASNQFKGLLSSILSIFGAVAHVKLLLPEGIKGVRNQRG
ncbi:MAG: hypothetical protein ACI8XU_000462 [Kiritimatiellia bacterium]|jgi:hypothetical protein